MNTQLKNLYVKTRQVSSSIYDVLSVNTLIPIV